MPITQDRLISLAASADALIAVIDDLRELNKSLRTKDIIMSTNALIEITQNQTARDILTSLRDTLVTYQTYIYEIEVSQRIRDNVAREKAHFITHKKVNEIKADYQRSKRQLRRQAAVDGVDAALAHLADNIRPSVSVGGKIFFGTLETLKDDPTFQATLEEEREAHSARSVSTTQYVPFSHKTPKEQAKILREEQEELAARKRAQAGASAGASTDSPTDSNVLGSNRPTLEELNKAPTAPDKPLF